MRFAVEKSDSYPSLLEASARRTAHEIAEHDYRHPPPKTEYSSGGALPRMSRRPAPPRRTE
ncbi:MAG TPA: hypothetical protein VGR87_04310 [Candidatus Limnocylindria bacterium]|nr:hypothetical protein [Candidatus Limnocylindria bacterium]